MGYEFYVHCADTIERICQLFRFTQLSKAKKNTELMTHLLTIIWQRTAAVSLPATQYAHPFSIFARMALDECGAHPLSGILEQLHLFKRGGGDKYVPFIFRAKGNSECL